MADEAEGVSSLPNRVRILQELAADRHLGGLHDTLRGDAREAAGRNREPSAGIIDSLIWQEQKAPSPRTTPWRR